MHNQAEICDSTIDPAAFADFAKTATISAVELGVSPAQSVTPLNTFAAEIGQSTPLSPLAGVCLSEAMGAPHASAMGRVVSRLGISF